MLLGSIELGLAAVDVMAGVVEYAWEEADLLLLEEENR